MLTNGCFDPAYFQGNGISLVHQHPWRAGSILKDEGPFAAKRYFPREKVLLLRDRIKELPEQQQKILLLYYYEELKLSEIAEIFSLTEGRISQILSHSILSLRTHFQNLN